MRAKCDSCQTVKDDVITYHGEDDYMNYCNGCAA